MSWVKQFPRYVSHCPNLPLSSSFLCQNISLSTLFQLLVIYVAAASLTIRNHVLHSHKNLATSFWISWSSAFCKEDEMITVSELNNNICLQSLFFSYFQHESRIQKSVRTTTFRHRKQTWTYHDRRDTIRLIISCFESKTHWNPLLARIHRMGPEISVTYTLLKSEAITSVVLPSPAPRSSRAPPRQSSATASSRRNWSSENTNIEPRPSSLSTQSHTDFNENKLKYYSTAYCPR